MPKSETFPIPYHYATDSAPPKQSPDLRISGLCVENVRQPSRARAAADRGGYCLRRYVLP